MVAACNFSFDAAHVLNGYNGKCGNLHGHTYKLVVEVQCRNRERDKMGMVLDYNELKEIVKPIIDQYDHAFLSGTGDGCCPELYNVCSDLGFKIKEIVGYSTTENIAEQILSELMSVEPRKNWQFRGVRLSETDKTYAEVYRWEVCD